MHLELLEHQDAEPHADVCEVTRGVEEVVEGLVGHVSIVDGGGGESAYGGLPSGFVVTVQIPPPVPPDDSTPAPPVVVVMVVHDPGWWFEETLASIAAQDYPQLSTLLIDAASADGAEVRERVMRVLPDAHLRRLDTNPGFAAAADEALVAVQGASFHLICHDDVRLEPDAVRLLVEEAFRSNAGIVGPKVVEWGDHRRLLSVGVGADRYGQPSPYVERGDLDQEQFDSVRDVFFVQGSATLVRADLFEALGGFDPEISFHGEDLDLCWRAHVAGARVIVAPEARVAHLEALGERRPVDDRRRLQTRHRLRSRRVASTFGTRLRVGPMAFLYAILEVLHAVVLGRFRHARDITSAWAWNVTHAGSARSRRALLAGARRVPDSDVRGFQRRGNVRFAAFLRAQVGQGDGEGSSWDFVSNLRATRATLTFTAWVLLIAYLIVGSRELLFGSIPAVGDFPRFLGAGEMLSRWVSGFQTAGLGSTASAPTGFGLFGFLGVVLLGAVGLLRHILILGLLPLGTFAMWRLTRPVGSRRARVVSTVAYVAVPLASNAMSHGDWPGLVAFAVVPMMLSQLFAASMIAPFGAVGGDPGPGVHDRPLLHRIVILGLITALAAMISPVLLAAPLVLAVVLLIGGILAGQVAGAARVLVGGIGGSVVAVVLQLPWSTSFITDWRSALGATSTGGVAVSASSVLRFAFGPHGSGPLSYAIIVAAVLPLLIGRRWRLSWAVRGWALALAGFAAAWVLGQGWAAGMLPSPSMLLAPAAVGIALAVGLGVAAFEVDLPDYHFGWRQIASILAGAAFALALLPALGAGMSGRWHLPRGDFTRSLTFLDDQAAESPFRVLWLGDAGAMPLTGWTLDAPGIDQLGPTRQLAFATSSGGTPTVAEQWASPVDAGLQSLADSLVSAGSGGTARLGALVAPMAVRYIVVPLANAPDPYASATAYEPTDLLAMLDAQLDLDSVTVNPGLRVYRNAAWGPERAQLPTLDDVPQGGSAVADRLLPQVTGAPAVLPESNGFASWSGTIDRGNRRGDVFVSASGGSAWIFRQNGTTAPRVDALGWASLFTDTGSGPASLTFVTPVTRWAMLAGQVLVWVLAVLYVLRVRVRVDEASNLATPDDEADA